jgi:uroporphyrinogen-III decarboxylase
MTPKRRVLTALAHKEPDRIPFDLGATALSSIHYTAYNDLVRYLGKEHLVREKEDTAFMDLVQSIVQVDIDFVKELKIDARGFIPGSFGVQWDDHVQKEGDDYSLIDGFGAKWFRPANGYYFDQKPDSFPLKKEFGSELVFWGAGVDTQGVLAFGNASEVKDEVKRRIDDLAPGGGFVFAAIHNIQPNVSPENIMAMWETLQAYGKY